MGMKKKTEKNGQQLGRGLNVLTLKGFLQEQFTSTVDLMKNLSQ